MNKIFPCQEKMLHLFGVSQTPWCKKNQKLEDAGDHLYEHKTDRVYGTKMVLFFLHSMKLD